MGSALFKQQTGEATTKGPPGKQREDGAIPAAEARLAARSPGRAGEGVAAPSVFGAGMTVVGRIDFQGDLELEGRVEGTISTRGRVLISERGSVEGEIHAGEIVVGGVVEGKLAARDIVRLRRGCRVTGELRSPAVELEEGGIVDGRVEMSGAGGDRGRAVEPRGGPPKAEGGPKAEASPKVGDSPKAEDSRKAEDSSKAEDSRKPEARSGAEG